jgi:DNA repair protein RadD
VIQPRYYQTEAVQSIYNYFGEKSGNCIIAMPTGTGKSIVIAQFVADVLKRWPAQRILMLTHVKELIEQNAAKLLQVWPTAPLGIYSAGLGRKESRHPITFAGVASVAHHPELFGHIDIILVDEAHLVSPNADTMYGKVFKLLLAINPQLKIVGLSATPYRLGQGYITDGGIFTDICYDLTGVDAFNRLIAEGFIAPLIPKKTKTELDVSQVGTSQGDYKQNELQDAVDREKITFKALTELMEHSHDRQCGLIFATGILHAEHINAMLQTMFNQTSVVIHSGKDKSENKKALKEWKAGKHKWAVSMNALTTGVDNPMLDVIGMLRPTQSPVLWVQMLGRGMRPSVETGKRNCLCLDFAGNTKRLGPINDPVIPKKKGKGTGEAPIRICDECGCYNHASARVCIGCGAEFEIRVKFKGAAGTDELLSSGIPQVELFDVTYCIYNRHQKGDNPATIRASYFCGMQKFDEWICLDHKGFARKKALDWLRQRMELPKEYEETATTDNVLTVVSKLRPPKRIRVWVNRQYPEILGYEY